MTFLPAWGSYREYWTHKDVMVDIVHSLGDSSIACDEKYIARPSLSTTLIIPHAYLSVQLVFKTSTNILEWLGVAGVRDRERLHWRTVNRENKQFLRDLGGGKRNGDSPDDHVAVFVGRSCSRSPLTRFATNVTGQEKTHALHPQYGSWDIGNECFIGSFQLEIFNNGFFAMDFNNPKEHQVFAIPWKFKRSISTKFWSRDASYTGDFDLRYGIRSLTCVVLLWFCVSGEI